MKYILSVVLVCSFIRGYDGARENKVADIIFRYFNGNTMSQFVDAYLPNSVSLLTAPNFNASRPTIIYIHGYAETDQSPSVQTIISTYLEVYPNYNIIALDWANMAGGDYFTNAVPNAKLVGTAVAAEIKNLINGGLNRPGIHILASSLGAHVAGYLGRILIGYNMKLKRMTAFDPAYPGFYPAIFTEHILGSDADFVDIIHTDAGLVGAPVHTGTADFWPNGGTSIQPGCLAANPLLYFIACSHSRAWMYWCEAVRNPTSFPAVPYGSWIQFKLESGQRNKPINYMGMNTDVTKSGDFYLQTRSAPLFGKGMDGTVYTLF